LFDVVQLKESAIGTPVAPLEGEESVGMSGIGAVVKLRADVADVVPPGPIAETSQ
jgi:hypothetical protein